MYPRLHDYLPHYCRRNQLRNSVLFIMRVLHGGVQQAVLLILLYCYILVLLYASGCYIIRQSVMHAKRKSTLQQQQQQQRSSGHRATAGRSIGTGTRSYKGVLQHGRKTLQALQALQAVAHPPPTPVVHGMVPSTTTTDGSSQSLRAQKRSLTAAEQHRYDDVRRS